MINPKDLQPGCEQLQNFRDYKGNERVQYDYRDYDGQVFSCIAKNIDDCIYKKTEWLSAK